MLRVRDLLLGLLIVFIIQAHVLVEYYFETFFENYF
jgi:hypothetical protein